MEGIMNKKLVIFIVGLALSVLLATWLIGLDADKGKKPPQATQTNPPVAPAASAEPAGEGDPASMEAPEKTPVPLLEVSNAQLNQMKKAAESAMDCCRDVYMAADKGSASNIVLSDSTVAELVYALGSGGYSAIDLFGNVNMQNPQPLIDFGNKVNAGADAEAVYYVVHNDGSVHANNLIFQNGLAASVTVSVEWDENGRPNIYSYGQRALKKLEYTQGGWLICTRDGDTSGGTNGNSYTFVRLAAYDDTKRQLSERYLGKLAYSENNLFTSSWSTSDLIILDFNCLFPILYSRYYGTDPLTNDSMKRIGGFENIPGTDLHIVPYEQFERVIGQYVDVPAETLRWLADSSSQYGGYFVLGSRQEFYNDITPKLPYPEVVDYWYNSDGSLTMKVNAVYPAYDTDCGFTHELTVMETETGFHYISNRVYEADGNIFPKMVLQGERKNQIASLKK